MIKLGKIRTRLGNQLLVQRIGNLLKREESWHVNFITNFAEIVKPRTYLEVGIYQGETFNQVSKLCQSSLAVDIAPEAFRYVKKVNGVKTYLGTVQEYAISSHNKSELFDLVFIDADHMFESVLRDFECCKDLTSPTGFILMHDTWPQSEEFASPGMCGDGYRAIDELRKRFPDWSFLTIPIHPGLTLASRISLPSWISSIP